MTRAELLKHFPQMSASTLEVNLGYQTQGMEKTASTGILERKKSIPWTEVDSVPDAFPCRSCLTIEISGQVSGGKNNMMVTRLGRHFPKKSWAKWRDAKVAEVRGQLPRSWKPISVPTKIELEYVSGDRRRRDQPAIIDAIFHVLEKAGVVADDTLLWISKSSRSYDKKNPRAIIHFQ